MVIVLQLLDISDSEFRTLVQDNRQISELLEKRKRVIADQGRLDELDKAALKNSIGFAEYAIAHGESHPLAGR